MDLRDLYKRKQFLLSQVSAEISALVVECLLAI